MVTISFVHATSNTLRIMKNLAETELRDLECLHFLDETLMYRLPKGDGIPPEMARRFCNLVIAADAVSPTLIVVTCSSYSGLIPLARRLVTAPVIAPDREMLELAVKRFESVTLIATLDNAAKAAEKQLEEIASELGKSIVIEKLVVEGAISLLNKGESEGHDRLVLSAVESHGIKTQGVVLCQFTIAHLEDRVRGVCDRPVLSSLKLTVENIRALSR